MKEIYNEGKIKYYCNSSGKYILVVNNETCLFSKPPSMGDVMERSKLWQEIQRQGLTIKISDLIKKDWNKKLENLP